MSRFYIQGNKGNTTRTYRIPVRARSLRLPAYPDLRLHIRCREASDLWYPGLRGRVVVITECSSGLRIGWGYDLNDALHHAHFVLRRRSPAAIRARVAFTKSDVCRRLLHRAPLTKPKAPQHWRRRAL